jgi:hypothetical protein
MACAADPSAWDNNAVNDSLAGKNTGPDPGRMKQAAEYSAAKDFLQERTRGFEDLKDKEGKSIIASKEVADNLARVELAREMLHSIHKIEFKNTKTGYSGRAFNVEKGLHIQINPEGNNSRNQTMHTIFHEIGESYYRDNLTNDKAVGEARARDNANSWQAYFNNTLKENLTRDERGRKEEVVGEHFARCFAEYCQAKLAMQLEGDKEAIEWFKQDRPEQYEFFQNMLNEFKDSK